ncbi:MAG TPA: DUF1345 domain-containing protein [Acidimicrobiales bacterium]|nr:DUF1345 domain-containing protein [Acidimicrobiales bacterium]
MPNQGAGDPAERAGSGRARAGRDGPGRGSRRNTSPRPKPSRPPHTGARRVLAATCFGTAAGALCAIALSWQASELIGWDGAALAFLLSIWLTIGRLDAEGTSAAARREDPSAPVADLVIVTAAVACIGGAGLALLEAANADPGRKAYLIALAVASVVLSWASVHTVFTLRYARLYYSGPHGGIDFNDEDAPSYLDFAYVAFTIGMTFQVSDTELTSSRIRRAALGHALLSYLFGAVIIGLTINVLASLLR